MKQRTTKSDSENIQRLLESPYFLKVADMILNTLDRKTLAELIAAYLYFKSQGRPNADFVFFVATRKFFRLLSIVLSMFPALLAGLLFDRQFRSVCLYALIRSFRKNQSQKTALSRSD